MQVEEAGRQQCLTLRAGSLVLSIAPTTNYVRNNKKKHEMQPAITKCGKNFAEQQTLQVPMVSILERSLATSLFFTDYAQYFTFGTIDSFR